MDPHPFDSLADAFESALAQELYLFFTYYHPERPTDQEDQYASSLLDECEHMEESSYNFSSTSFLTSLDPSGGRTTLNILGPSEHGQLSVQHAATIPPGKMSTYSELMPHVVADKTIVSLKQDFRVEALPQPCVSPALCQGHADLPECAETDDELDCPGELAADFEAEPSYEEEGEDHSHSPPPPSPYSTPSPPPSHSSSSSCCDPSNTSRVVRSCRGKSRYSPMETKSTRPRKRKPISRRGSDSYEAKKPRKLREAVSLACFFCRRRKIACRQPPADCVDRTCHQCKVRGMKCEYPTESRRGTHRTARDKRTP